MFILERWYLRLKSKSIKRERKKYKRNASRKAKRELNAASADGISFDDSQQHLESAHQTINRADTHLKVTRLSYIFTKGFEIFLAVLDLIAISKLIRVLLPILIKILVGLILLILIDIIPATVCFIVGIVQINIPLIIYGIVGIFVFVLCVIFIKKFLSN